MFEKKSQAQLPTVEVSSEVAQSLLQGERWSAQSVGDDASAQGVKAELQEFVLRPVLEVQTIDVERLTRVTADDIIERFLRVEPHRIVAEQGEVESEIVTEAEFDDEDEMVSEELAEVYLKQGLKDMAKETYIKLSLLNPEKSVYFAEIISKIDSNN